MTHIRYSYLYLSPLQAKRYFHIYSISAAETFVFLDFDHPVLPPLGAILWTPFLCCQSRLLHVNPAPQTEHLNGLSPVWYLSCATRFSLVLNVFAQVLHWNWGSWCHLSCSLTSWVFKHLLPQNLQAYFGSVECSNLWCLLRAQIDLSVIKHWSQLKPVPCSPWN